MIRIKYVLETNHHSSRFTASGQQIPPPHPRLPKLPQSGDIGPVFGPVVAPCEQLGETRVRQKTLMTASLPLCSAVSIFIFYFKHVPSGTQYFQDQFPEETVWSF